MSTKRYILIADYVYAPDGERYFVSSQLLAKLYKVNREDCIYADATYPPSLQGLPLLPKLYPQHSGQYELAEHLR